MTLNNSNLLIGRNDPCPCGSGKKFKKCCMDDFITQSANRRVLYREETNIMDEANYIMDCAQNSDIRIVTLAKLIFFSTDTGDAWMLDPEDNLALCLVKAGVKQPFIITETANNFSVEWQGKYIIAKNAFLYISQSGKLRTIFGYPTKEIMHVSNQFR